MKKLSESHGCHSQGVHVAKLLGMDAESFLKDPDAIVKGVVTAAKRYKADGVCAIFDLQVEPEVLGCRLKWAKNNPPCGCWACSRRRKNFS